MVKGKGGPGPANETLRASAHKAALNAGRANMQSPSGPVHGQPIVPGTPGSRASPMASGASPMAGSRTSVPMGANTKASPMSSRRSPFSGRKPSQSPHSSMRSMRIPTVQRKGGSADGGKSMRPTVVMVPAGGEEGKEGTKKYLPLILLVGCILIIVVVLIIAVVLGVVLGTKKDGDSTNIKVENKGKQDEATTTTSGPKTTTPEYCTGDADVILILDASGSIFGSGTRTWKKEQMIMRRVVEKLPIHKDQIRVAVILYSDDAMLVHSLKHDQTKTTLEDAINKMPCDETIANGGDGKTPYCGRFTTTEAAFKLAHKEFQQEGKSQNKVLMIVTDGEHNGSGDIEQAIEDLNDIYVDIYVSTESSKYDNANMLLYTRKVQGNIFVQNQALDVVDKILKKAEAKKCSEISQG